MIGISFASRQSLIESRFFRQIEDNFLVISGLIFFYIFPEQSTKKDLQEVTQIRKFTVLGQNMLFLKDYECIIAEKIR